MKKVTRGRTMNEDAGWDIEPDSMKWADYESQIRFSVEVAQELYLQDNYTAVVDRLQVLLAEFDQDWRREMPGNAPKLVAQVYYYLGMSLWMQAPDPCPKKLYENILGLMRTAVQIDRNSSSCWVLLTKMLLNLKTQEFDEFTGVADDDLVLACRGVLGCMPPNKIDSAWAFYVLSIFEPVVGSNSLPFASAAVQLDPGNSDYWTNLGDMHPIGSYEQMHARQTADSLKPDRPFIYDATRRINYWYGAKQCERSRLIIFDLDGTLANTANIEQQNRTPATLLAPGVDAEGQSLQAHQWEWSQDVSETPARLIERGHRVVIATNSPLPYASTLTHLLGVEHCGLHTNCGGEIEKANRIMKICSSWGITGEDVIYVGDREVDVRTAARAGVSYMTVDQLRSGELLDELGTPLRGNDPTPFLFNGLDVPKFWKEELSSGRVPFSRPGSPAIVGERKLFKTFAAMCEWITSPRLDNCDFLNFALAMGDESGALAPYYRTMLQFALRSHPGLPQRRDIQFLLLIYAANDEHADLIPTVVNSWTEEQFAFRPGLLTRREKNEDYDLRQQYLRAFRELFPALNNGNLSCVVNYWGDGVYGNLLKIVKDYRINPKGPGPAVRLGLLDGVADMCAGMMSLDTGIPIVPVPSSPFHIDKPGQTSTRLARCIADRTARQLRPILEIDPTASPEQKEFRLNPAAIHLLPRGSAYDLFDDQITSGLTVRKCRHVMDAAGYRLNRVLTYSAKASNIAGASQNSIGGTNEGAHLNRWRHLKIRFEEGF